MTRSPAIIDYEPARRSQRPRRDRTRRERLGWGVATAALMALTLRAAVSATPPRNDDLAFVRTLGDVTGLLERGYVREVDPETLRRAAVAGMLNLATDPHTVYVPPAEAEGFDDQLGGQYKGIGVTIVAARDGEAGFDPGDPAAASGGIRVLRPLPGSPAAAAGLLTGDVIVGVDGQDVRPLPLPDIQALILGPAGTEVELSIERPTGVPGGEPAAFDVAVGRAAVQSPVLAGIANGPDGEPRFVIEARDLPEPPAGVGSGELPRVAYVRLATFVPGAADRVASVLAGSGDLDGLILDLRSNPGGLLTEAAKLADLFLDGGVIVWSEGANAPRNVARAGDDAGDRLTRGLPVAVLLDRASASASEVFAGALQDHGRATVVGERSFGKGSVQDVIDLADGGRLKMTTAYYHLPGGRVVQREAGDETWGIDPDVPAPPTEADAAPAVLDSIRGGGPAIPSQVWRAYAVLLAELAAER